MTRLMILAALLAFTSTANASYLWTKGDAITPPPAQTQEIGGSGTESNWFARLLGYLWAM